MIGGDYFGQVPFGGLAARVVTTPGAFTVSQSQATPKLQLVVSRTLTRTQAQSLTVQRTAVRKLPLVTQAQAVTRTGQKGSTRSLTQAATVTMSGAAPPAGYSLTQAQVVKKAAQQQATRTYTQAQAVTRTGGLVVTVVKTLTQAQSLSRTGLQMSSARRTLTQGQVLITSLPKLFAGSLSQATALSVRRQASRTLALTQGATVSTTALPVHQFTGLLPQGQVLSIRRDVARGFVLHQSARVDMGIRLPVSKGKIGITVRLKSNIGITVKRNTDLEVVVS